MKKIVLLSLTLLVASSAVVTSQPFSASITIFPGCGLQYSYGQKVYGEIYVSHDAWVTRWVEDQYGTTWYHWGTRYYTAGTHTFCGYMGFPIGLHTMKISATRASDGAVAEDQCEYTVCCASSVWIPERPTCSCEQVVFTAELDKTRVTPGDYITVTVTVTNNMAEDCKKKFDAGHLEIDWGILGGNTSPLERDILVRSGETRIILEEKHLLPPVSEGDYNIVIFYSDSECTWIDYATLSVTLPTEGSFEILSYPDVVNVDERGRIKLLIRNQSQKKAQFTLFVTAPSQIYLPQTVYTTTIVKAGYEEINVEFQPKDVGVHTIELELVSDSIPLGRASISVNVEKPLSGKMTVSSKPLNIMIGEPTSVILNVENPGQYDTTYQISAVLPENVQISAIPELFIPKSQFREAEIFITPTEEGVHEVTFQLTAEGQFMDAVTVSFEAEKETPLFPIVLVVIGIVVSVMIGYVVLRNR
jgi:hypothetical protein